MQRASQQRSIAESPAPNVELAVGLILCAIALARIALGASLDALSWDVVVTAAMAGVALGIRQRWPILALALAIASGLLAMSMDLRAPAMDLLLGLSLMAVALGQLLRRLRIGNAPSAAEVAIMTMRKRWPMVALAVIVITGIALIPIDFKEAAGVAILFSAYAVGSVSDRTIMFLSAALSVCVLAIGSWLIARDAWTGPDTPVPMIAAALVGAAIGDASRSRRQLQRAAEENTRRIELAHAEESRRRIVEERLRIARDVHDLVAHHLAVVNVHASVADHLMRDQPAAATEALAHVRSASRTALEELGTLLAVLRDPGEAVAPTEPARSLADLGSLLNALGTTGTAVDFSVVGSPRPLPPSIHLAAFRIVQESLTNAQKYGSGPARLTLTYSADRLAIEVRNGLKAPANPLVDSAGTGHGLAGMRERAAAVGGQLEAGPSEGGEFTVRASLPAPLMEIKEPT
jgi:signal transduction histidine kinase